MSTEPLEIRPLTPARLADFLAFFEGPAFADNPKWRSCYCQFLHVDHSKVHWMSRTGVENRAAASKPDITGDAENHYGPMSMYLSAGFRVHKLGDQGSVHVRKALT